MAWGKNGNAVGTGSTSFDMTLDTNSTFNEILVSSVEQTQNQEFQFNSDTGNNYSRRWEGGGTEYTQTNINGAPNAGTAPSMSVSWILNIATEEKLIMSFSNMAQSSGAGNAPGREIQAEKWTNTTDQINTIKLKNETTAVNFTSSSDMTAIGSDLTPTAAVPAFGANVQIGSRYEETDTRKLYNYVAPSITLEDDFSSDNWTTSSSTYIGIDTTTDNEMDFNNPSSLTGQHHSYYDLGLDNVSDTKWVLRWKWEITTISENSDGTPHDTAVGISNNTVGYNTAQDALTLRFRESSTNDKKISLKSANDPEIIFGGATDADFTTKFSVSTFYCELKRTSATSYTANIYSDSSYSTLTESQTGTCSSSITGLRYLKVGLNNNDGTANGQVSGHIDDVKFYNGVTQTTNYWQEIGA